MGDSKSVALEKETIRSLRLRTYFLFGFGALLVVLALAVCLVSWANKLGNNFQQFEDLRKSSVNHAKTSPGAEIMIWDAETIGLLADDPVCVKNTKSIVFVNDIDFSNPLVAELGNLRT